MNLTLRNIFLVFIVVLTGFFSWYFFRIILYLLISVVLSLLGQPMVEGIHRFRIGKYRLPLGFCALITLLFMIGIFTGLVYVFFPLLANQAAMISEMSVQGMVNGLEEPLLRFEKVLRSWRLISLEDTIMGKLIEELVAIATFDKISHLFSSLVNLVTEIFISILAISFMTFFFLKEKHLFSNMVVFFTPRPYKEEARSILEESKGLLRGYFTGLISDLVAVFILISLCMWILGLPNALVIGFFAGLLNIIPYVGPIIATFIGMLLGVSVNLDMDFYHFLLPLMFKIGVSFLIVNTIDIMVLQPAIYSKSVKAHPLEIFLVFMVAGMLGGVFGMIIAIPTYTVIRIFVKQFLKQSVLVKKIMHELEL